MSLDTGGGLNRGVDVLGDLFYPLYRRLFDDDGDFVGDVETKLVQARMATTVELYLSRALAVGVLLGLVLWVLGTLVGYSLFAFGIVSPDLFSTGARIPNETVVGIIEAIKVPAAIGILGIVAGSVGFTTGFGTLVAIPYSRASSREREINMLLSDSISFMYALSVGGLNQLEILEAMARAEDTYGEVAREFQSIVQETEYFGTDYRNAIQQQAIETPSDDLSQFLTDMLSIVNSGGNMQAFLSDKKDKHMRTAKQQQEVTLDTLELFGEMYMTLSLFPLLLIIILVIMSMLGEAQSFMLYATVYGLIPITGVMFLVLVSTVKQDEPGDGYLDPSNGGRSERTANGGLFSLGLIENYVGEFGVFDRIRTREGTFRTKQLLRNPHHFFRDHPLFTLALTAPTALVLVAFAGVSGAAPTTWDGMVQAPVWGTFVWVYVPLYLTLVPLGVFHEWNVRSRAAITGKLSDNLRKLSSANDTGQTLLESVNTVAETSSGKLADEFDVLYAKVNYGMSLRTALIEFNNKYHIPRLARTVKLISKAQEASSQITEVLTTAAQASENQDDIERERRSRTRMQVAIILMTYLTLLGVMAILKTQFLDVMAGLTQQAGSSGGGSASGASQFGGGIDTQLLSLLFFHAVTLQAILSGIISGYIRTAKLMAGVKFVVILQTIALAVWLVVG